MGSTSRAVGDFPFKDKIFLVTGGGSGIGLALCQLAIQKGARGVLIGDLKLTPDAERLTHDHPKSVFFAKCDVTKWADLENLIPASKKHFDGAVPDIYAPIAGVFEPPWSNFWTDPEPERYAQVDINVNHPLKLTRIAVRALLAADKPGVVAITASTAGLYGNYNAALYVATKHAVVGFVKSMADADETEGVKVVAICPGVVMSPLWTDREDDKMELFNVKKIDYMTTQDIALSMENLITKKEYSGGTVMKRDIPGETIEFEGGSKALRTATASQTDTVKAVQALLQKERGAK